LYASIPPRRSKPSYSHRSPLPLSSNTRDNGRITHMSSGPYIYEKLAQLLDQDRNVSHAQGLSNGTSSVFCEILPVTLESNQVV
jgi:hypothetical protein